MVGWHFVFLLVHIVTVTTELKSMSSLSSFKHMLKESMLLMWLLLLKSLLLLPWIFIVCQFYAFGGRIFVWCKFTVHFSFCPIPCVCLCFVYLLYAFVLYAFVSTQKKNTYTFFPLSVSANTDDDSIIIIVWARNSNVPFGFSFVSRSLVIRLTPFLWLWMRKKQLDNNIHQTDLWIILIELILQASNFCLNIFTN